MLLAWSGGAGSPLLPTAPQRPPARGLSSAADAGPPDGPAGGQPAPGGGRALSSVAAEREAWRQLLDAFRRDSATAARLVHNLDDDARRELTAALERAQARPELSRATVIGGLPGPLDLAATQRAAAAAVAAAATADVVAAAAAAAAEPPAPTLQQLLRVGVTRGIPFVAFGFFDNMIMITAGEQIDLMFGAKLGLSSMAAAGLGNTVADVVGINISHSIESRFKHMKSMAPQLTKAQMKLPQAKRAAWLGCAVGMAVGCLLGLTPLLFYETPPPPQPQQQQSDPGGGAPAGAS
ncbi:TMEM65 [Scenedesmus sp. PABB004]|nr:TMEM65 [Scenedesmus sp. PABB004]